MTRLWGNPPNENIPDLLPRYCGRCGKALERMTRQGAFNEQTGRAQFYYWLYCPDAERPEEPYRPEYNAMGHVRYVMANLSGWAEKGNDFITWRNYVDCRPWPKAAQIAQ